jgi:transposase-like protein
VEQGHHNYDQTGGQSTVNVPFKLPWRRGPHYSIIGAYHHVSAKHLDRYLDELEWRFNNRQNPFLFRDTLRQLLKGDALKYGDLTA